MNVRISSLGRFPLGIFMCQWRQRLKLIYICTADKLLPIVLIWCIFKIKCHKTDSYNFLLFFETYSTKNCTLYLLFWLLSNARPRKLCRRETWRLPKRNNTMKTLMLHVTINIKCWEISFNYVFRTITNCQKS